jgi:GTPase
VLGKAVESTPPRATRGHKPVKILYASQVGVQPPTFVLQLSQKEELHFSYLRYLENQIRRAHPFEGSPIVIKTRARKH